MKLIKAAAAAAFMAVITTWAAEPAAEVKSAVQKLADKESYSWTSLTKWGENSRFEPRPWHGKTADGTGTLITMTGRDDQEIQVAIKGDQRWMKTEEGWKTLEELAQGGQGQRGGFM